MNFVAKTLQGLEGVLAQELINLGATDVKEQRRAVSFKGDNEILYKANLQCRTALRILRPIASFTANNADEIYDEISKLDIESFMDVKTKFLVDTTIYSDIINNSRYATYRVKDAIVDYFNDKYNKRPSISVANPDLYFNLHISHTTCTLSLDSSGEPLYKRGYRTAQTDAPINEVLAAGMLLLAGWNGQSDFLDPMCGSGTIAIEAALIALNIAPGIFRKSFAFEKWKDFDQELFNDLYNDDSNEREFNHKIYASDILRKATAIAEQNIKSAGLTKYIEVKTADFAELESPKNPLLIVTNPPYGERLRDSVIEPLYSMIGTTLKFKYQESNAWIISSSKKGFDKLALKPTKTIDLLNGDIECDYRHYQLFSGKRKEFKKQN